MASDGETRGCRGSGNASGRCGPTGVVHDGQSASALEGCAMSGQNKTVKRFSPPQDAKIIMLEPYPPAETPIFFNKRLFDKPPDCPACSSGVPVEEYHLHTVVEEGQLSAVRCPGEGCPICEAYRWAKMPRWRRWISTAWKTIVSTWGRFARRAQKGRG